MYAIEISRLERMALKQIAGILLYVLPIRTFGPKCSCYDPVTGRRLRHDCRECLNSGYSGGFHAVETYGKVGPYTKQNRDVGGGIPFVAVATKLNFTNYPLLKKDDIVIEPRENMRWRVSTITPKKLGGCIISQDIDAVLLDPGDIAYEIDLTNYTVYSVVDPPMMARREESF
jgi:hypothetical protein